ncbi:MAG: Rieske 2Fe-2S domain-containing protein [Planctomycetota bacterium]|jgi:nitrite reductase/ring-hydroxylating ferredoxin subunit/DMSO/TMAO reductase YedYZ heme-binding membrane subunit
MSVGYRAVGWNRNKRLYDTVLVGGVALYLLAFALVMLLRHPAVTAETVLLRATGSAALILLHVILCIGPLCRLDPHFLPLLYNRRHMGVTMFLLALVHGAFAIVQYHALGDVNPIVSVLTAETRWDSLARLPFQPFGALALLILFLMAATSHDFWLTNLTAPVWKALHMLVYVAWGLLLLHVMFGVVQDEVGDGTALVFGIGGAVVAFLHVTAGRRETGEDRQSSPRGADGWVDACDVDSIVENRARLVTVAGERVAIFRWEGKLAALGNACQHQNGPLGEGRIVDGCVTCPWHGYQYRPEDGCSPPPFTESVPTFRLRLEGRRVFVDGTPCAPGTQQAPVAVPEPESGSVATDADPLYIGWQPAMPRLHAVFTRRTSLRLVLAGLLVGVLLAAGHGPFRGGAFEFGTLRRLEGVLSTAPQPMLRVARPGSLGGLAVPVVSRYLLVAEGKRGVSELVDGLDGRRVAAYGTLIWRDGGTMFELSARPEALDDDAPAARGGAGTGAGSTASLGRVTLAGEIVDSKCWLGVMVPGQGRVHRACAIRCLSGGIPPLFHVATDDGRDVALLLVGPDGTPLGPVLLDRVAEPLTATGELVRHGDLLVLRAASEDLRPLAEGGKP